MLVLGASSCTGSSGAATSKRITTTRRTVARTPATTARPVATVARPTSTVVAIVSSSEVAAVTARAPFQSFEEVRFVVTGADGKDHEYCALLADTEPLREQGLMGRTDLGGYDAMLFGWDVDTTSAFWMRTVPVWLSIAWFDKSGTHVGQLDMAPCGDSDSCPRYGAAAAYRWAMETMRGGLDRLGVRPGAMLRVGGRCRAG